MARKKKSSPEYLMVAQVTAPSFCRKVQFDEDTYIAKAYGPLEQYIGVDARGMEEICEREGWKYREKFIEKS